MLLCWAAGSAEAQVQRLPASVAEQDAPALRSFAEEPALVFPPPLTSDGSSFASLTTTPLPPVAPPAGVLPPSDEDADLPRDARKGFFQRILFDGTWLAGGGENGLGMGDLQWQLAVAVPMPTKKMPMLIVPGFTMHFLDGLASQGLPERVYDAYTQFRWLPRVNDRLMFDATVTPGVYRDFDHATDDGLRVTAHLAAVWKWTPTAKIVGGAMYLARPEGNFLPVGGLLWNPTPNWNLELLFPQPKVARRVYWLGSPDPDVEDWIYVSGEFSDWIWAIQRNDGSRDSIFYRDARVILGAQRKRIGRLSGKIEVGYVFWRRLESLSERPAVNPNGTVMLRAGLSY